MFFLDSSIQISYTKVAIGEWLLYLIDSGRSSQLWAERQIFFTMLDEKRSNQLLDPIV